MRKLVVKTAIVLFAIVLTCGGATQVNAKVKVKSVSVKTVVGSNKTVYVAKGKKVRLETSVTVTPNSAKNQKVTYKSNKKAVATVSTNGVIKGRKIGNAKVTVQSKKDKKKKATIKVRVVYPVKTVTISNKNAVLNLNDSKKLSAKVTGTKKMNFCKTVQWTTSNKKVAIVSANGTVKAIGVGTATITAKAVDGTGKKASCIAKVAPRKTSIPKLTSISGISFRSYYNCSINDVMYVSLNQPKALTENDFSIMKKSFSDAKYIKAVKIDSLFTSNNKDYFITLNNDLYCGDYVQVTINALNGAKTKEQRFMSTEGYKRMSLQTNVGYYFSYYLEDSFGDDITVKIDSGSLPAGLSFDAEDNVISGTATTVTNNQKCIVSLTDQRGYVVKCELNFIVGDVTHIVAANKTFGDLNGSRILSNDDFHYSVDACGGSESYTYEIKNNCNGLFSVNSYGNVSAKSGTLQQGTYNPVIRVKDKANDSIKTDTTWTVVITKGAQVSVKLTTSDDQYSKMYIKNIATGNISQLNLSNGLLEQTVDPGTYDLFYYSTRADGERRCNYLEKNLSITQDTTLQYTISNIFNVTCHLQDLNGNVYYNRHTVFACMFNSSGKFVGATTCSNTARFSGYESGNYYICFYDQTTKQLIGKSDVFALNGKEEFPVKLNS